jgi:hypothetical protein
MGCGLLFGDVQFGLGFGAFELCSDLIELEESALGLFFGDDLLDELLFITGHVDTFIKETDFGIGGWLVDERDFA